MRWAALALALLASSAAAEPRRVAIVVGANAARPGRVPLRYAHDDARAFAALLTDAGGFAAGDVDLLLDPPPATVLARLEVALASTAGTPESLLVFYYSGHADGSALLPAGQELALPALKALLEDGRATVRVGIVDACRGGTWTGAKGLKPVEPFDVEVPLSLGAEGSALLSSSSGLQDAHESEVLGGSFFTHHLVAGLRGAADRGGDGEVTLSEAFEYAKELTLRDSALLASAPQHPSFDLNLRGRRDLPLTRVPAGGTTLLVDQERGPIELVRLDTGLVVAEIPAGQRRALLALPPGRYLVRRRAGGSVAAAIELVPGVASRVAEAELARVETGPLAAKGGGPPASVLTVPRAGRFELRAALGQSYSGDAQGFVRPSREADTALAGSFYAGLGLSERLELSLAEPGLGVRFGQSGSRELLLWGGVGWTRPVGEAPLLLQPLVSAAGRLWLTTDASVLAGAGLGTAAYFQSGLRGFDLPSAQVQGALMWTLGDAITLGPAVSVQNVLFWDPASDRVRTGRGTSVRFGAAFELGRRAVPLLQVHLLPSLSLDALASLELLVPSGKVRETYLGGITWTP